MVHRHAGGAERDGRLGERGRDDRRPPRPSSGRKANPSAALACGDLFLRRSQVVFVLFNDWSAIIAPMLVFTEFRRDVWLLTLLVIELRIPRLLRAWGHIDVPELTANETWRVLIMMRAGDPPATAVQPPSIPSAARRRCGTARACGSAQWSRPATSCTFRRAFRTCRSTAVMS